MTSAKYTVKYGKRFKKAYKLAKKRGEDMEKLEKIVALLANGEPLPEQNKDLALAGNYEGFRNVILNPTGFLCISISKMFLF